MVFVFGTVCIDRIRRIERLPGPGGYAEVQEEVWMLGGEAANTANALKTWGVDVRLAGNDLGSGPHSAMLRNLLRGKGLPLDLLDGDPGGSGHVAPVCDVYVAADGERTMFGHGFAEMAPSKPFDTLPWRPGSWFTAEPNMGVPARDAVRAAVAAGMRPYLMDFIRPDDPVLPGSVWQSSTDWAGHRSNMQRNVRFLADFVAEKGCLAVLSDGPNGFVAGSPDMPVRAYPPFPAPSVVDTTGAGDMFRAGLLFGLDQGWPIADGLRFASAAGCLKCRTLGGTTSVPTVEEVQRHIAEHPEVARQYGP